MYMYIYIIKRTGDLNIFKKNLTFLNIIPFIQLSIYNTSKYYHYFQTFMVFIIIILFENEYYNNSIF